VSALVAACLIAALLGIVAAFFYLRRPPRATALSPGDGDAELSAQFDHLPEAERCDFIFALAALDEASSVGLLERALDDPCEAVALAAAHALAGAGNTAALQRFFERRGARAECIARSLELLA
jgi:hypothetical protein